jgi:hypothetical protein
MVSLSREQLIDRARYLPKNWLGRVTVAGWFVALIALACLIGSAANQFAGRAFVMDWRLLTVVMTAGVGSALWAGWRIQRDLEADAKASGLSKHDLLAIEDEAERLNEEEY